MTRASQLTAKVAPVAIDDTGLIQGVHIAVKIRPEQVIHHYAPDVATTTDEEPERQGTAPRPFWDLAEDDKRTLYMTIVGGLVANVGLVLIVGLGLLEAHLISRYKHALGSLIWGQLAPLGGAVVALLGLSAASDNPRRQRIARYAGVGIAALVVAVAILGVVGYAAGIK